MRNDRMEELFCLKSVYCLTLPNLDCVNEVLLIVEFVLLVLVLCLLEGGATLKPKVPRRPGSRTKPDTKECVLFLERRKFRDFVYRASQKVYNSTSMQNLFLKASNLKYEL